MREERSPGGNETNHNHEDIVENIEVYSCVAIKRPPEQTAAGQSERKRGTEAISPFFYCDVIPLRIKR